MSVLRAFIFDLDGTLFNSGRLSHLIYDKTFAKLAQAGIAVDPVPDERVRKSLIGMTAEEALRIVLPQESDEVHRQAMAFMAQSEKELIPSEGQLFPGVKETLTVLRDIGHPLFIASNGSADYVLTALEQHEIQGFFAGIFCAGIQKTASKVDLVRLILAQAGWDNTVEVPTGSGGTKAWMVGDRLSDIEAGKRNGLPTVGCAYGYGNQEELADADEIIQDIQEILRFAK